MPTRIKWPEPQKVSDAITKIAELCGITADGATSDTRLGDLIAKTRYTEVVSKQTFADIKEKTLFVAQCNGVAALIGPILDD
jgi:hypothetical protein